jgi:hypothetical protein
VSFVAFDLALVQSYVDGCWSCRYFPAAAAAAAAAVAAAWPPASSTGHSSVDENPHSRVNFCASNHFLHSDIELFKSAM